MEEKTIIKSERYNISVFINILLGIGLIAVVYSLIGAISRSYGDVISELFIGSELTFFFIAGTALIVLALIIYAWLSKIELTVTDKRVYGTAAFGKRVDLPFDMISAIGTSAFKGIAVTTPSGAIKFLMIKNKDKIHNELSKLLIDRQGKTIAAATIKQEVPLSNADELRKYKELLDSGAITQEEYNGKKKQLLGL